MRRTVVSACVIALLAASTLAAGGNDRDGQPKRASYGNSSVVLDDDWDGAGACAVFADDDIRCWATFEDMEAATNGRDRPRDADRDGRDDRDEGHRVRDGRDGRNHDADDRTGESVWAADDSFVLAADCRNDSSKWLYLWEHADFRGRVLKFNDVSYWQNLTDYGFNDRASSFWNATDCNAYLAEHTNGGGSWLFAPERTSYSSMPTGWNDRISSLYILS